jgi:hypothetical protein
MTVHSIPVDQRVIDIDSRRFALIEKAVEHAAGQGDRAQWARDLRGAAGGNVEAFHAAKQDIVRKYGSDIHLSFMNREP